MPNDDKLIWIARGGKLALDDRLSTHGLGVFETILAVEGRLIRPDWHCERMLEGCARLGITPPDCEAALSELRAKLPLSGWHRARITHSGGRGSLRQLLGTEAATMLSLAPITPCDSPVTAITAPWPRNEFSPLAQVKASSYLENLLALDLARRAHADQALFLNTAGNCAEAATANLFMVRGGEIITPPLSEGCLAGTTRRWLLETLPAPCKTASFTKEEAMAADGVFLGSATRGPLAVSSWDGISLRCPPLFAKVRRAWLDSLGPPR